MTDIVVDDIEDVNTLANFMDEVLEVTVGTMESYGLDVPVRQYLHFGEAVHDCEQVTVSLVQMYMGPPGDGGQGPASCEGPRTAVFQIQVVRCIPKWSPSKDRTGPPSDELIDFGHKLARDAWALLDSSTQYEKYNGVIADVAVTDPLGNYQAVVLNLVLAVN